MMNIARRLWRVVTTVLIGLSAACASGRAPLERLDPDQLMARAMTDHRERRWAEAISGFERFTLEYPTHARVQEARFYLADSYLGKKEYVTAAGEFVRLATDYPTGSWADDARFKTCEAYYRLSPSVQRDQQYTLAAVEHCESLVSYYPNSEFTPRANEIIVEMSEKLAEKLYIGGEFYFRRKAWDPAVIYFEDVVEEYPRAKAAPRALLRLVEIYKRLGYEQEETAARERLLKDYPESTEAKQIQSSVAGTP